MVSLDEYLADRRREVDAALDRYLPAPPECPPLVHEAMRYSMMAGGKRLRPVLTLATAEAVGQRHGLTPEAARCRALPAACAIEMIHTYSLIHDDLPAMDDDVLRRGQPTLHVIYGEGMAILAGDGLQAAAFALLAREPSVTNSDLALRKLRSVERVAIAAGPIGMVGGQAIDLEAIAPIPGRPPSPPMTAHGLEAMHARKTGALIRASAVVGAILADGTDDEVTAVDHFATDVGLAFQIVDDILDVEGVSQALGKTAGKDAAAGKPTYPSLFGIEQSRVLAEACLSRARSALQTAGFGTSRLTEIAERIVNRQS